MSIKERIRKLESVIREEKVSWQTKSGETIECHPRELFALENNDSLRSKVLDADLDTFEGSGSLLSLVRAFLLSLPEMTSDEHKETH